MISKRYPQAIKRIIKFVIFPAAFIAAASYLFVLPALVATGRLEGTWLSVAFAALMLVQLWMLVVGYAYESAAAVYGLRRKRLFFSIDIISRAENSQQEISGASVLFLALASYLCMVYGFGVLYIYLSHVAEESFKPGALSFIQGMYFSLITATTVGYGDITPDRDISRVVVMLQIIISLLYIVVLFSSIAGFARGGRNGRREAPDDADI